MMNFQIIILAILALLAFPIGYTAATLTHKPEPKPEPWPITDWCTTSNDPQETKRYAWYPAVKPGDKIPDTITFYCMPAIEGDCERAAKEAGVNYDNLRDCSNGACADDKFVEPPK
jgi:hypothetical protein